MMKRLMKAVALFVACVTFTGIFMTTAEASDTLTAKRSTENTELQSGECDETGTWTRTFAGVKWYFEVKEFTGKQNSRVGYGKVYIYIGTSNYNRHKFCVSGKYYKCGTNNYYMKYFGGKIYFNVNDRYIVMSQVSGKISKRKISGKFTLVSRERT